MRIELLIAAGADINAKDICDDTPWDQALPRKLEGVCALVERHGGKTGVDDEWDDD